ncbi:MAG: hypothetical protein H3C47_14180, partial [Candidatus Cloacimonetes bacterium]|nr:hypothetical protein [Candidatus Cloacimonadota bacterium]
MLTLGITAYSHDSSITLLSQNIIVAACEEERFSRKKHDGSFPVQSLQWLINTHNLK